MGEAKPTPGPWFVAPSGRAGVGHLVCVLNSMHKVCADGPVSTNAEADARLIAEAGTVYGTTGLTPSQLVERVKGLEELLNGVLLMDRMYSGRIVIEGWQEEVLRAALSKARPNTAEGE